MPHKLAIDFGTTNSVIARWNEETESAELVSLPKLSSTNPALPAVIPSLVYVADGETPHVVVGEAVKTQALTEQENNRLFRNFKRGLVSMPAPPPRHIDGLLWADREAGHHFIRTILQALPYQPSEVEQLVLTAPVAAFEHYIRWLHDSIEGLVPEKTRIVDESTAAALGYAITEPGSLVLVFDFGGGTLDLSLVELPDEQSKVGDLLSRLLNSSNKHLKQHRAKVIAKAGRIIGGSDIDQWLLGYILQKCQLTPADLGPHYSAWLTQSEIAKIRLSTEDDISLSLSLGEQTHDLTLSRTELETLLTEHGFYKSLRRVVDKAMYIARQRGIFREHIDYVLMVGGTSLMPSIQAQLRHYFMDVADPRNEVILRADKPFTAVAEGALQVAAGYGLQDYLVHSYGLHHVDPTSHSLRYDEIIPMGASYPSERPYEVILQAARPQQEAISFVIGEIDTEAVGMVEIQYQDGQAVFVAEVDDSQQKITPLNASQAETLLARLDPPGTVGEDRLRASFSLDEARQLWLTVEDLQTGATLIENAKLANLHGEGNTPDQTLALASVNAPTLSLKQQKAGQWKLSPRRLGTLLNVLPADSISMPAAAEALQHKDFHVRYNAGKLLARRGDREARLIMQTALSEGSTPTRASVARFLYAFSWFAAEPLIEQALNDADVRVHETTIYALCDRRELNAYQRMTEALRSAEDDAIREAATWGLRDCRDEAAVPALEAVMLAEDHEIRIKALEALGLSGLKPAETVVRHAFEDPHPLVVHAAVMSLLELAGEACLPELATLIRQNPSQQANIRAAVVKGLFQATNYLHIKIAEGPHVGVVLDALAKAIADPSPLVRQTAIWPLAWIRHPKAENLLLSAFENETDLPSKLHFLRIGINLMSPAGPKLMELARQSPEAELETAADALEMKFREIYG